MAEGEDLLLNPIQCSRTSQQERELLLGENECILALNPLLPAVAEMAFIWNPLLLANELFCGVCQLLMKLDFAASLSCASQTLFPFCEQWQGAGSAAPWLGQMGNEARPASLFHPQETGRGMDETSLQRRGFCCLARGEAG